MGNSHVVLKFSAIRELASFGRFACVIFFAAPGWRLAAAARIAFFLASHFVLLYGAATKFSGLKFREIGGKLLITRGKKYLGNA